MSQLGTSSQQVYFITADSAGDAKPLSDLKKHAPFAPPPPTPSILRDRKERKVEGERRRLEREREREGGREGERRVCFKYWIREGRKGGVVVR